MGDEENLARRVKLERQERGWSPAQLAELMTAIGCRISTSAIYKIEDGIPRRAIRVDELVALSAVLGIEVSDLLKPVETIRQEKAFELVRGLEENGRQLAEVAWERVQLFQGLLLYAVEDPELHDFVVNQRYRAQDRTRGEISSGLDGDATPVSLDPLAQGFASLEDAVIAQATENAAARLREKSES